MPAPVDVPREGPPGVGPPGVGPPGAPARRARRVTARDVARAAGVSPATVSYVLNRTPTQSVSEATRRRVHDAVRDLDDVPSAAARALPRGHDETVVWVAPADASPGGLPPAVLTQLAADLEQHGLSLRLRRRLPGQGLPAVWRGATPAAVVVAGGLSTEDRDEARRAGVVVLTDRPAVPPDAPVPLAGHVAAAQVRHLAARGHRRVALLEAPGPGPAQVLREARVEAARRAWAWAERGLPPVEVVVAEPTVAAAVAVLRDLRARRSPVTGVAGDDEHAAAVLAALRRLGLRAPDDLAVVGAGDQPLSALTEPPLTTVAPDHRALSAHLVRAVLAATGRPLPPEPPGALVRVVERASG